MRQAKLVPPGSARPGRLVVLNEGAPRPAGRDMAEADVVVVGNQVLKNRHGRTGTLDDEELAELRRAA